MRGSAARATIGILVVSATGCISDANELDPGATTSNAFATGLASGWVSSCLLDGEGQVACWGNVRGEVDPNPTYFPELEGSQKIGAAYPRVCGLLAGGQVRCVLIDGVEGAEPAPKDFNVGFDAVDMTMSEFGNMVFLGPDGRVDFERTNLDGFGFEQTTVEGLPPVKSLGGGGTCIISDADRLWCWSRYELNPEAVLVEPNLDVIWAMASNDIALALTREGEIWTLPVGEFAIDTSRRRIQLIDGARQFSAGVGRAIAVTTAGEVFQWIISYSSQDENDHLEPVRVDGITDAVEVTTGIHHGCARNDMGDVSCFGSNVDGQLGRGVTGRKNFDTAKIVLEGARNVAAGDRFSCAVTDDGLSCWGWNKHGQAAAEGPEAVSIPTPVIGGESLVEVSAGWESACAVREPDRAVLCWGHNDRGQAGADPSMPHVSAPQVIEGLADVTQVVAGAQRACAITNGELWCWGRDDDGRFGVRGGPAQSFFPRQIPIPAVVASVALDSGHACAIDSEQSLWCWGRNRRGESGGSQEAVTTPLIVDVDVAEVALDHSTTCAVHNDGSATCFGDSDFASTLESLAPIRSISLPSNPSCALRTDDSVWCWSGEDATATKALDGVAQFSGSTHSCWVSHEGAVRCAGQADFGQLGDADHRDDAAAKILPPREP